MCLAGCSSSDGDAGGAGGAAGAAASGASGGTAGFGGSPTGGVGGNGGASPVCSGTARSCNVLSDVECARAEGCDLTTTCSGIPDICQSLDGVLCGTQPGCYLTADGPPALNVCSNAEVPCAAQAECCQGDLPGGSCVYTGYGTVCRPSCTTGDDCESGCCKNSICADLAACGRVCGAPGLGCETHDDCCSGTRCVDLRSNNTGLCAAVCTTNSECEGGCCRSAGSTSVCVPLALCP